MNRQKSADGIVVATHGDEGLNMWERRDAEVSSDEGDAGRMTEMSEDYRRVMGRTRESKDRERQTSVATEGNNSSKVTNVMKKVMRRYKPYFITTAPSASRMNRRMPNGTYGGVRGRG